MMDNSLTICGVDCGTCPIYQKECPGCDTLKGQVFWAKQHFDGFCPLYECAVTKNNFRNCNDCSELPCSLYYNVKDPSISDEENIKIVNIRVNNLKNQK